MKINLTKPQLRLLFLLVAALALRTVKLGTVPNGLHADEASFLLNAAAIKQNLHDEDNRLLPLYLYSIKDTKPALNSYLEIPFITLFGVTTFSSRLPSALMGVLSVYLLYLLVYRETKNRRLGLAAAAVLTFSPWHILISRATQEIITSCTFSLMSLIALHDLLEEHSRKSSLITTLEFIISTWLALYTYHSAKIFLLLVIGYKLGTEYFKYPRKNSFIRFGLLFLVPLLSLLLTASGAFIRFNAVGLFSTDLPTAQVMDFTLNSTGKTPFILLRIFYNKAVFYGRYFIQQYFAHFTGDFWFLNGGRTGSHMIPAHGLLYALDLFFLIIGVTGIVKYRQQTKIFPYWLAMLLAAPIAASLTTEDIPSNTRAFMMVIPLSILIAYGVVYYRSIRSSLPKKMVSVMLGLGYIWSFGYFVQQYFVQGPLWHPWYRSRDYDITAQTMVGLQREFNTFVVTNDLREMYIYLWLHGLIAISDIQQQPFARYQSEYSLGPVIFNRNECDFSQATIDSLIVGQKKCLEKHLTDLYLYKQTYFDDGVQAFSLYQPAAATVAAAIKK